MSDSDSDLEFESADEGLKGEEIDTDDLGIDDDDENDIKLTKETSVLKTEKIVINDRPKDELISEEKKISKTTENDSISDKIIEKKIDTKERNESIYLSI